MDLTSTVLLVDDDLAMRQALEELLTAEGYGVACASNGAEALVKATQLTPDLILLDVVMPDMDGLTVCQRLRADPLLAEVPIIMVTSLADRTSRLKGFEAGADDYVSKPIDAPELLARVRTTTRLNRYRRLLIEQAHRQQAEAALRESEARFRSVVEQSNDGIVLTDEQGVIIEWNQGTKRIFGLQRDEALGQYLWDVQFQAIPEERRTPASYERLRTSILESLRAGQSPWLDQLLEMEVQRPDGEHRFVQTLGFRIKTDQGSMLGSISRDITERRQAEEALRDSERRYRLLIENTPTVTWVTGQDGKTTYISANVEKVYGYSPDEILEAGEALWFGRIHPEDRDRVKHSFESLFSKQGQFDLEYRIQGKDGNWIWVRDRANLVEEKEGNPYAYGVFSDITERKQAEEALHRERDRAQMYLDVAGVMMLVLNTHGEIVLINRRGCQILGCEEKTLIGRNWFDACLPASISEETKSVFEQLMEGKVEAVEYFENPILTSSGEERIIAWHNTILGDEAGRITGTLSSGEDITERKHAEQALQRYAERLEILHEIDQGILAAQSPEAITRATVTRIRQLIPCQRATVAVFDPASGETVLLAVDASYETEVKEGAHVPIESLGDNITALEKGQIATWEVLPSQGGLFERLYAEGMRSYATIPLITQGELIGSLNLALADPDQFTEEHEDIARQLTDQLAIAIQQTRLHNQVERHAEELEQRVADRTRELSVLYEVAALASQSLDLETTLARSLEQVLEAVESNAGAIHLLDEANEISVDGSPEGKILRMVVQRGISPNVAVELESLPPDEGLGKWLVEHDEPLIIPDITADPRLNVTLPIEPHAYVGIPLRAGGRTSAVLSIVRPIDQPRFNVEELSLLTSVADQLGIVVESARLRKRAEQAAALEERERLARDLHDSVTQLLYSVNLFARSARNAHDLGDVDELDRCLIEVGDAGQQALKEMRLMVYELRPRALEQEGLIGAIQHRLDAVERRVGVATQLLVGESIELPERTEQDLYHITIEALNNALKYAKATSVTVSLDTDRERVRLEVTDDGAGFDPRAAEDRGGLGIVGMRERAKRLGGALQVISAPGEGTTVRVELEETRRDS